GAGDEPGATHRAPPPAVRDATPSGRLRGRANAATKMPLDRPAALPRGPAPAAPRSDPSTALTRPPETRATPLLHWVHVHRHQSKRRPAAAVRAARGPGRSEERRVGKEGRAERSPERTEE